MRLERSFYFYLCLPPDARSTYYQEYDALTNSGLTSSQLRDMADKRISLYHSVNARLDGNRHLTVILCAVGLVLLLSKVPSIELPLAKVPITREISCWLLPLVLLFIWLDFGYTLNRNIDSRLVCMRLIDASHQLKPADLDYLKKHYTITRASELEDNGFIDCWFWNFHPDKEDFPVNRRGWYNHIVPIMSMAWYGALYGLLHALIYLLPHSLGRKSADFWLWTLFIITTVILFSSHSSFYWAGGHRNWFQPSVLAFSLFFFHFLRPRAEKHYTHDKALQIEPS